MTTWHQLTHSGASGDSDAGYTNVVLTVVNAYVTNYNCAGVGYSSRADIPEILEWIEGCPIWSGGPTFREKRAALVAALFPPSCVDK